MSAFKWRDSWLPTVLKVSLDVDLQRTECTSLTVEILTSAVDLLRLRNAVSHVHAAAVIAAAKAGRQISVVDAQRRNASSVRLCPAVPQAMEIEEELNIKQTVSEGVWSSTCRRGCPICLVHTLTY